ncbi:MAG: hypothetical protein R3E65_07805 [Steroidobacteraceae bacterium]
MAGELRQRLASASASASSAPTNTSGGTVARVVLHDERRQHFGGLGQRCLGEERLRAEAAPTARITLMIA